MARRPLAALTCLAVVAACDGGPRGSEADADTAADTSTASTATVADAGPKACDLVTVEELESIVALDFEPGRTTNDYAGDSKCEWDLPGDAQRGVAISLRRLPDLALYRNVPGGTDVAGLGDEAVWNATYGQLALRRGDRVVSIALLVEGPRREHAERIARLALARL